MPRPSLSISEKLDRANAWGFAVTFTVVNAHVLRNASSGAYLAVYAITVIWVTNRALTRLAQAKEVNLGLPFIWLLVAAIGAVSTAAISDVAAAAYGLSRFLFAFPIFFAFVAYTRTREDLQRHFQFMCTLFAVGALSIPLQYFIGPISFFATSSERAGLERFASAFGSLTSLGVAIGSYIALSQCLRPRQTILTIALASIGGVASLSKAAIANIVLGVGSHVLSGGKRILRTVVTLITVALVGYFAILQFPILQESLSASASSFGVDSGTKNYDLSFKESLTDRLIDRPKENWSVLSTLGSPLVYMAGGGFGMASTALVPASASLAEMAHNQFAEFLSVFGIIGGLGACLVVVVILRRNWRLHRSTKSPLHAGVFFAMLLWAANSWFANGTAYQPLSASIFFMGMFVAAHKTGFIDAEYVLDDSGRDPIDESSTKSLS